MNYEDEAKEQAKQAMLEMGLTEDEVERQLEDFNF